MTCSNCYLSLQVFLLFLDFLVINHITAYNTSYKFQKICDSIIPFTNGPRSIFIFRCFLLRRVASYRGERQLLGMKKYWSYWLSKVIEFSYRENTYTYTVCTNFNCDFPKINFKIYLLLQFSKLGS